MRKLTLCVAILLGLFLGWLIPDEYAGDALASSLAGLLVLLVANRLRRPNHRGPRKHW